MNTYLLLKWLHILSATILFGTGLGTAFFMWRAWRSGNIQAIAVTTQTVVLADTLFTTPAVLLQPVTGFAMMYLAGYPLDTPWILAGIALYLLAGACWLPVVWIQFQLRRLARESLDETNLPQEFATKMRYWVALGIVAFSAVLAAFLVMVYKPYF